MSFGQDEEELDWGDNVDVVSLGDEDEIPRVDRADENEVHEPASSYAPHHPSTPEGSSLTKTRSNSSHALGLSHLPPKPHTVVPGRRSRETIKAAAMSRSFVRDRSPPPPAAASEVPRNWETRRETQPPPSDRSNASSGRAAWPERPTSNNRSARPASPASPPPRARSPADPPPRPNAEAQPSIPARAMSPSSMLIPRRGQSPARGLAKNSNPQTYEPADGAYSNNEGRERRRTRNDRGRFSPGSPQVERARVHDDGPAGFVHNGRRRENVNGGMDHYSPPPEGEVERPRQGRSASPPRRTAMRSDSMVLNQRARRSLSPRDPEGRFERPPLERMASDSRVNRGYGRGRAVDDNAPTRGGRRFGEDMRREYTDMPDELFRGRTNPMPPNSAEGVPLHRDSGPMPPNAEDPRFHAAPFRGERFNRPDNRRQHSSRANQPRPEPPSVSPHDVPRREFMPPRDNAVHVRARNGDRIEPIQRRDVMPLEHEPMPMPAEEHEMRHDERIRPHRHRHTVSREEYVVMNGLPPQELLEGHMAQPGRNYPRPRDFPHEGPEQQFGGDFRPREAGRFPNNAEQPSYPRPLAQESIAHDYESSPMPHGRHMPLHDVEPIPNRYPDTEQPPRDAYPRHYTRDDQFADRTSQTWERGVEVPTPPPEEGRHRNNNRRHQSDGRRSQREAMSDTEYIQNRDGGRARRSSRTGYDDLEVDARPRRHTIREAKPAFVPDDRQWTPRPLPPVARMEIDVHEEIAPPNEVPPGWAEFHSRDRSPQVGQARSYRRPGAREVWPPADPDHDMGPEAEGGKRQKVEGGTKMTSTFSRDDEELPRKVPHHSPNLRPKPRSPVNSFTMVLQPVPAPVPAPVDIQASLARAKNVASQLSAVNPATRTVVNPPPRTVNPPPRVSPTRTKSRFSQPVQAAPVAFNGPDSLSVNTRVGGHERGVPPGVHERNMPPVGHERGMPPGVHERNMPPVHERGMPPAHERNMPPVHERNMPPETNEGQPSRLEVPRDRRQGSEGSGDSSTPLVARMGDASLGDERTGNTQTGRPGRNTRWDSGKRDRNRNGDFRNGNNGNRGPRGDFWRPENDDGSRGSGMRAWDNPEPNMQRHEPNMQRHEPGMQRHEPNMQRHESNMQRHEPNMQRHEPNLQRDEPPHSSFAPNRSFVPRDSNFVPREARQGDSNFVPREARQSEPGFVPRDARQGDSNFVPREARNRPFAPPEGNRPPFAPPEGNRPFAPPEGNRPFVPEGLPPRPATPPEFSPPMSNSRGRNRAQSSPQRERFFVADADMVDAPPDPSSSSRPPQTLSFLSASNPQTPRKHSLLDRMTEPGTGERPLVARLSTGEQGINDGQLHRQNDGQVHRQQRRLKVNKPTRR